ncbi:MAG: hypothetical protein HQL56_18520 [Magnetococcales bacterium]|nr:hypothetical protein [Magnetococcales bacterium]
MDASEALSYGLRGGSANLLKTLANIPGTIDQSAQWLAENIPGISHGGGLGRVAEVLRQLGEEIGPSPSEPPPSTLDEKILAGIGQMPAMALEYLPAIRALGAVKGMAAVDALRQADKGWQEAALGGAQGALFGGALHAASALSPLKQFAGMGAIGAFVPAYGAAKSALETGTLPTDDQWSDIGAGAITNMLMAPAALGAAMGTVRGRGGKPPSPLDEPPTPSDFETIPPPIEPPQNRMPGFTPELDPDVFETTAFPPRNAALEEASRAAEKLTAELSVNPRLPAITEQQHLPDGSLLPEGAFYRPFDQIDSWAVDLTKEALLNRQTHRTLYTEPPADVLQRLTEETGANFTDALFTLESAKARHIIKHHGNPEVEAARAQVAVTPADLGLLSVMIANFKEVRKGSRGGWVLVTPLGDGRISHLVELNQAQNPGLSEKPVYTVRTLWFKKEGIGEREPAQGADYPRVLGSDAPIPAMPALSNERTPLPDSEGSFSNDAGSIRSAPAPGGNTSLGPDPSQPQSSRTAEPLQPESSGATGETFPPGSDGSPVVGQGFAGNINLSRIYAPEDVHLALKETADALAPGLDAASRGRISHEETSRLADELGMTVEDLMKRRKGQALNAEEALAARRLMVESGNELAIMAKQIQAGQNSDAYVMAFKEALARHGVIQGQVAAMTAEAGRALNAFKILATLPERTRAVTIRESLDGGQRYDRRESLLQLADMIANAESPGQVARITRDAWKPGFWDKFFEYWINGLLSSPRTHAANAIGNTLSLALSIPESYLAAGVSRLTGWGDLTTQQATARLFGIGQGLKEGAVLASRVLIEGDPVGVGGTLETAHRHAISGRLGQVIRTPSRLLMTGDAFFKSIGYRMSINEQAMRLAQREGLTGDTLTARVAELSDNPTEAMMTAAEESARYWIFSNPLGKAGKNFQNAFNSHPMAKIVVPFFRTPVNIFKRAAERSPLALVMPSVWAAFKEGGNARATALARVAMGSTIGGAVALLAAEGLVSGGGPAEPKARALLRASGWQPYSLRIGDRWVSYNRLDPLGMIFGMGADFAEIAAEADEGEADGLAGILAGTIVQNLTSKTFLQGLSSAVKAVGDPTHEGQKFLARFAGSLVPAIVADGARLLDPVVRETQPGKQGLALYDAILNKIQSRIPGMSHTLPPRLDYWGNPIAIQGALGPDWISPLAISKQQDDPLTAELLRNRAHPTMPNRKWRDVWLEPEEYNQLLQQTGPLARTVLERLINSPGWQSLPDNIKTLQLKHSLQNAMETGGNWFVSRNPGVAQRIALAKRARQAKRTGTPYGP